MSGRAGPPTSAGPLAARAELHRSADMKRMAGTLSIIRGGPSAGAFFLDCAPEGYPLGTVFIAEGAPPRNLAATLDIAG